MQAIIIQKSYRVEQQFCGRSMERCWVFLLLMDGLDLHI